MLYLVCQDSIKMLQFDYISGKIIELQNYLFSFKDSKLPFNVTSAAYCTKLFNQSSEAIIVTESNNNLILIFDGELNLISKINMSSVLSFY